MRALFFGTPQIAVPALDALASLPGIEIPFVVCQPDRPAGRGLELKPPPVKQRAQELGLLVHQPSKVKTPEFAQLIRDANADVALVIAYGRILTKAVLEAPRRGCLNLHASLLPKYRGAAPITWAVVNGERETGVCLMQMDEGMDTGPVLSVHRMPIGEDTTADELYVSLGELAAAVVRADLERAVAGELTPQPQDHAAATMAPMLEKENGRVSWDKPGRKVHDHVRGMTSWPGAFTTLASKTFKILGTRVVDEEGVHGEPGEILSADKHGVEIACGRGKIALLRGQLEGKKALSAVELVAGRSLSKATILGR